MLYANKARDMLYEAAAAEFLDPDVSEETKEVITDIQDDLTNNIEMVDAEDKETNNTELTVESCPVFECSYGYAVDIRDIMRICEAEEEMTGEPADAGEVASDVAAANDVSEDELVIVAPVDVAQQMIEACLFEAKCGKSGKSSKKAKGLQKALKELKAKGIKVAKKKK